MLASGLNAVEKAIIVVVAYGIAILAVVLLFTSGYSPSGLIFPALAVPLAVGACSLKLRGGLLLGGATALIGILLLLFFGVTQPAVLVALLATDLGLGGGIGLVNRKRDVRRNKWRRAKSVKGPYEEDVLENSLNMIHFTDKNGTALKRNEASRSTLGYPTKRSLQLSEYVHPNDADQMKMELLRLFERGERPIAD